MDVADWVKAERYDPRERTIDSLPARDIEMNEIFPTLKQ
jgi:hypothetical protein